jgi:hypothetical protein
MYVYRIYPAMSTSPRNKRRSNRFGGFLCEVHTYTVTVLTVAQHESGTRKAISLVSDHI